MIRIYDKNEIRAEEILFRDNSATGVEAIVSDIINNVRTRGDDALMEYCAKFDGGAPESLEVSRDEIDAAYESVDKEFIAVLEEAAENIRAFHSLQKRDGFSFAAGDGKVLGQKVIPLNRVGL